jgi:hypothetical protein
MNRFVPVVIGLIIALLGPASAGTMFRHDSGDYHISAAGEIRADGSIKRGLEFTARRIGVGQYEVKFVPGYFGTGAQCAAMTVGSAGSQYGLPVLATVTQPHCSDFLVTLWNPYQATTTDHRWQFTAVAEEY